MAKAKKKARRKKVSRKRSGGRVEISTAVSRVSALEERVLALEQCEVASQVLKSVTTPVTVVLSVDASENTAKFSRLYFPGSPEHDLVNNLDKQRAELPGQQVGSTIQLMMEVRGDPGQKGAFTVHAATPTPLTLSVDDGPKSPKLLFISG